MCKKYYSNLEHFMSIMEKSTPKLALQNENIAVYETWKIELRAKLSELLGFHRMTMTDPKPQMLESTKMDGYTRNKMVIETEPGVLMPFYVLIPGDIVADEKRPAVIAPHGHVSSGKDAVVGNKRFPQLAKAIEDHNYDYGVQAVRLGLIAFCPDARGFGERREKYEQGDDPQKQMSSSCQALNAMAMPLGMNVTGMWTWDLMRLMDYVQSCENIDADRIGCIGLSGGGLQTLYFAAMDDRVKCIVISGYFYGFRESLQEELCCNCNYVPHLWEYVDVGDVGALIAPRPLLIETGSLDTLNGKSMLENVVPYVDQVRTAYALYHAQEALYHDIFEGPHMWHGVYAMPWLGKYLKVT